MNEIAIVPKSISLDTPLNDKYETTMEVKRISIEANEIAKAKPTHTSRSALSLSFAPNAKGSSKFKPL